MTQSNHPPSGTRRIIGAVVVAGGRALDVALVESDGANISRRLELERKPVAHGIDAVSEAVISFMGDRSLQPSAIDVVALAHDADWHALAKLRGSFGMTTQVVDPLTYWPNLPLVERIALTAGLVDHGVDSDAAI